VLDGTAAAQMREFVGKRQKFLNPDILCQGQDRKPPRTPQGATIRGEAFKSRARRKSSFRAELQRVTENGRHLQEKELCVLGNRNRCLDSGGGRDRSQKGKEARCTQIYELLNVLVRSAK